MQFLSRCAKPFALFVILQPALFSALPLVAQEGDEVRPSAELSLGLGESDNVNRNEDALRSNIARLGVDFDLQRDGPRLSGALLGDLDFRKYEAVESDNEEVLGSVDGLLRVNIVPERLRWNVRVGTGQVRLDPRAPISRQNRERATVASMGPSLTLPLGSKNSFDVRAEVSQQRFSDLQTLDSQLKRIRVGVSRAITSVTRVGLSFESSENEFDLQPDPYDFEIALLEYRKELSSGAALASVGRGSVKIGDLSSPTTVSRVTWTRNVGSRSSFEVWGGRELTDAGQLFAAGGVMGGRFDFDTPGDFATPGAVVGATDGRLQGVTLSRSPLRRDALGARFTIEGERSRLGVSLGTTEDRFEIDADLDSDGITFRVDFSRQLGLMWEAVLSAALFEQSFTDNEATNQDELVRFALTRLLARESFVEMAFERNTRTSDTDPFEENVAFVSLGRRFGD